MILAAHGDGAERWASAARRSPRLAIAARVDLAAQGVEGLSPALASAPDAAVAAWCKGPREASEVATLLSERAAPSLIHPLPHATGVGGDHRGHVQLALGWLTLAGLPAITRLLAEAPVQAVRLRARGAPEGATDALDVVLRHALALVGRLGAEISVESARLPHEDELQLELRVDKRPWTLSLGARGHGLELVAQTARGAFTFRADAQSEVLARPGSEPRAAPLASWEERSLKQLLEPVSSTSLEQARAALALVDQVEQALERRLPPPPSRVRAAAQGEWLARIGLRGALPDAAPASVIAPPALPMPAEAMLYAASLVPAVFLTVEPERAALLAAQLPGLVERVERRVLVEPGDRWVDDRERGEPRVEIYAARTREHLDRLMALQRGDPSASLAEIGALLGYPACCVQVFAAQVTRADNTLNRYATAARTSVGAPWPGWLDDTSLKLLPHFACTYRCESSLARAASLTAELARSQPELLVRLKSFLCGPVLYFDHERSIRFDGEPAEGGARFASVSVPGGAEPELARLAGAIALGDHLVLGEDTLSVRRESRTLFTLARTDPGLGLLLPFGRV